MEPTNLPPVAPVLQFNSTDRISSRRLAARKDTIALYEQAQQAEAAALGLTDQDERDDPDLYAHFHIILDVEAAYGKGRKEGRAALLAAILTSYTDGCESAPCAPASRRPRR